MADVVSKAALSRELGLSRARISQLSAKGLPVRADGKLNRRQVLAWIEKNLSSNSGGWSAARGRVNVADKAAAALHGSEPAATPATASVPAEQDVQFIGDPAELYETIRAGLVGLPALLARVQGIEPWVLMASVDAFDNILGHFVYGIDRDLIDDDQDAAVEPDYGQVLKGAGIRSTAKERRAWKQRAEQFLEDLSAVLCATD